MNVKIIIFSGLIELKIKGKSKGSTKQMQQRYIRAGRNLMKYIQGDGSSPFIDFIGRLSASIKWMYYGSVVYVIQFKTTQELLEFKRQYEDGELRTILEKELTIPEGLLMRKNQFIAEIDEDEFNRCKQELDLLSKCSLKFNETFICLKPNEICLQLSN